MAKKAPDFAPWKPTDYTFAEAAAVHALMRGAADVQQQRLAMQWIMRCAGIDDISFRPDGMGGERDTCLAEGKRLVGTQIRKLATIDLAKLRKTYHGGHSDPAEDG